MKARILSALMGVFLIACSGINDGGYEGADYDVDEEGNPSAVEFGGRYIAAESELRVSGQYIVRLKDPAPGFSTAASSELLGTLSQRYSAQVKHNYQTIRGFVAVMSADRAKALAADPEVEYVEEDQKVSISATQSSATWGIDRIDQRDLPLSGTYTYNNDGSGVNAYIVDTGIRTSHAEFSGRAFVGYDAIGDGKNGQDCNGHGTHVAGTVGGKTYGVAKATRLYAIRVLDCAGSGTTSGVIAGIDWVTANHVKPAVANMSLGGGASQALDDAVAKSISAGVTYAVAAGNDNKDACNYSPARAPAAITVGSTTSSDARSSFSNWGTCLDIFAPGSSITSAWHSSDTATNTISGTSMASPHVAGAAVLYVKANSSATPQQVRDALVNNATLNKVTSAGTGSPNKLLYSAFIGGGGTSDTTAPTTSITSPSNGSTVSGTITISADASDAVGVTKVEFYRSGTLIGTDTSSPYAISWDTTKVSNGDYTLTSKAYDSAGNVGTSSGVGVKVSNSTSGGSELLTNGYFDSGSSSPWTLSGAAYYTNTGAYPHSGTGYTYYGAANSKTGYVYQTITIPSGTSPDLTFYLNVTSSETTTSIAYDKLYVEVRNTSGSLLKTLATYSNLNKSSAGSYSLKGGFDLGAWAGQKVRIQFRVYTDSVYSTTFRVDTVSVK